MQFPKRPIEFSHQYDDIYAFIPEGDKLPTGLQAFLEPALQQLMEAITPVMTEPEDPVQLVETVRENKMGFTDQQLKAAKVVRNMVHSVGFPTYDNPSRTAQ